MRPKTAQGPNGQDLLCRIVWRLLSFIKHICRRSPFGEDAMFDALAAIGTLEQLATPQTRQRIERMTYHWAGVTPRQAEREWKKYLAERGKLPPRSNPGAQRRAQTETAKARAAPGPDSEPVAAEKFIPH